MAERILIVDDERLTMETLLERLRDEGFKADALPGPYEALEILEQEEVDVILTDLRMPSMDGLEFHKRIRTEWPDTAVIFMTAFGTVASAVQAMREGAADYLTKPLNTEELIIRLRRILHHRREVEEIQRLRALVGLEMDFGDLIYRSIPMRRVVNRALAVAETDATVLIRGATGTGKEVLSRAIHAHSPRAGGPFVAVNAAGLNPNLVESELFGHEAGSFTGATRQRKGRLEVAAGGTLLIDEVDDLGPEVQLRLLRFLQDRTFERVGSSRTLDADVRIVCATKRDLEVLVEERAFREDLFYRVNTVLIELPPLRERPEDILLLAEHFLRERCKTRPEGEEDVLFSPEALGALLAHDWPGNVRELEHVVEHALMFARCDLIEARHLPAKLQETVPKSPLELHLPVDGQVSLGELVRECERQAIDWALTRAGGNQAQAAEFLSIPRTTLRSRLQALSGDDSNTSSDLPGRTLPD
jgi:DNA-binding NtrC family response regulator